jgi:hypothetical protein
MNIATSRIALRDRTMLDVFDLAVRFVSANLGAYAKVSAAVSLPLFFVSWAVCEEGGWWLGWCVAFALASLAEAAFVALASRLVFEERVPTGQVLASAASALPRLAVLRLLELMGMTFGAMFFLVPAVWISGLFLFATEVIVLERATVGTSVSRLQRLGTGYFGDVLMAMLLVWFLTATAILLGEYGGSAILEGLLQIHLHPSEDEIGGPLALLGMWLAVPFLTTARFFVYLNLRTRREGWDIQTRFAAIAARAEAEEEAPLSGRGDGGPRVGAAA